MSSQVVDIQVGDVQVNDAHGMNIDVEGLARRITRDVWDYTDGLPGRWVPLIIIQERLALKNETATINAVQHAVEQRWLEEFGGHNSIRLTGAGRSIV